MCSTAYLDKFLSKYTSAILAGYYESFYLKPAASIFPRPCQCPECILLPGMQLEGEGVGPEPKASSLAGSRGLE